MIQTRSRKVAKRISTRKALLDIKIDIMVNDYTNQQIRSTTTIHLQRGVVIDTYIWPCVVDSYTRIKTTVRNDNQRWKRSKRTMEAIKSEIRQLVSMITFKVSLLYSPIHSNKRDMQQTMGWKESRKILLQARIEQWQVECFIIIVRTKSGICKLNEYVKQII